MTAKDKIIEILVITSGQKCHQHAGGSCPSTTSKSYIISVGTYLLFYRSQQLELRNDTVNWSLILGLNVVNSEWTGAAVHIHVLYYN